MKIYTKVSKSNGMTIIAVSYLALLELMQCFVFAIDETLMPVKTNHDATRSTTQNKTKMIRMYFL